MVALHAIDRVKDHEGDCQLHSFFGALAKEQ